MKRDQSMVLIIVQLLLLAALFMLEWINQPQGMLRGVLFIVLFFVTGSLLLIRIQFRTKLRSVGAALKRAVQGNVNTRVLTNDDPIVDEVIFSINELIEHLAKVQVLSVRSEAARRSLLTNISHDIRTPLTSIIGYVDALKDNVAASPEERQHYIQIISNKAIVLKELIDEIFHLAKLDADEIPLQVETVDAAEMAREAVIAFLPELDQHNIELRAVLPEEKCMVLVDRLSLLRILNNLIKNAVQYGKEGKVLGIELAETVHSYQFSIWDKGAGIAEQDLMKIFDKMYRADRSRNTVNGGSGLGLAITKALVEKNGGTIWVESEPDIRTTFNFTIPKAAITSDTKISE
ncbi:HAMP domain-containing histidine kinase [Paenibacillus sp. SC116]|uniref:sensor histidine kinase n=1 Tax=Paenibacillus sp. SC116 TaxID=2968986 RepID=UPI00215A2CAA|nr:HAMP domain-containing sensor histidine kinase [Paenibacillus sp. SC116]MCR8845173.1 HAMP domain-containing histidine kinase [Paenibacillus sp. SC116]